MGTKIRCWLLPSDNMCGSLSRTGYSRGYSGERLCSMHRTECDWDKRIRKPYLSERETGDQDAFDSINESAYWSDLDNSFLNYSQRLRNTYEMRLPSLPEHEEYEARNAISRLRILKEELSLKKEEIVKMKQELNNEKREREKTLSSLFERTLEIQLLEKDKKDDNWEIENLQRTNRRQEEKLKHFSKEIVELENKLSTAELQKLNFENETNKIIGNLEAEHMRVETELKLQIDDYGWQLHDLEQQKRELQKQNNENEHSIRKLSEKNSKLEYNVQLLQKEKNLTENRLYEEESNRKKQSQEISRSERTNQELETENRNLRFKINDRNEKLLQSKTSSVTERKESLSMRQILPRIDNEKSSYKAIEEMERRLCEKNLEIHHLQQDKNTLMTDLKKHQQKSEKLQEEIGILRSQNELYRKQLMQEKETAKIKENECISLKKFTTRTQEDTSADEVQKQLREENTELKRKIEQLNKDKKNLAEELRYEKETEKKRKSQDILKQQDECRNLQKEVDRLRQDNQILNNKLRLELENFHLKEQTLNSMQRNVKTQSEEISLLKAEVENERQMKFEHQINLRKLLQENKDLTKELTKKKEIEESTDNYGNTAFKGVSQTHQDDVTKLRLQNQLLNDSLRQEREKVKQIEKDTNVTKSDMQKQMEIQASEISILKQKLKEISAQNSKTDSRVSKYQGLDQDMQKRLDDAMDQVRHLQKELDDTKSRLSRAMGDRLTDNNPNIADLSDKNRPTKLSERFQELYDNQWTDAFEIINATFKDEGNTINTLRMILVDVLEYCKTQAAYQMNQIKETFLKGEELPANMVKQVKECRKAMAEQYGKGLYRDYYDQLRTSKSEKALHAIKTPSYVKECFEVCWLMAVQDPPVVFGPDTRRGDNFNKDHYRPYTRSGERVDFVVWPVLLLYQNGPVLCKGVAQGK